MFKRMVLVLAMAVWLAMPAARAIAQHDAPATAHAVKEAGASAHGEVHGDAHGGDGEHDKAPLLPDFTSRAVQLQSLWVVIIFVVLLMILYPTAWKNVLAGLKNREQRIRQDIADAEAARVKSEATLKEYTNQLATAESKVRDILSKATVDAEKIATSLKMQAQQEAEEAKERAQRDIETARKAAVNDIYAQAAELSTSIAEKILRRNLNAGDQRDLVSRSLEQLQSAGKV